MAKNISFYIDESGEPDQGTLFVLGGYYVIEDQKIWQAKNEDFWNKLEGEFNCKLDILTHRTELRKYRSNQINEITERVLSQFSEEDVYYVWLQGIAIRPETRALREEYYLSMVSQLISDSIEQLLKQFQSEDSFKIEFYFEAWSDKGEHKPIEKNKYKEKIELVVQRLQAKDRSVNKVEIGNIHTDNKGNTCLALADYVTNIVFNYYRNTSRDQFYNNLIKRVRNQSIYGYDTQSIQEALAYKDFRTLFMLYIESKNKTQNKHFIELIENLIISHIGRDDSFTMNGVISLIDILSNKSKIVSYQDIIDNIDILKNLLSKCSFMSKDIALFYIDSFLLAISNHAGKSDLGQKCIESNDKRIQHIDIRYVSHIWAYYNRKSIFYLDQYKYSNIIAESEKNIKDLENLAEIQAEMIKDLSLPVKHSDNIYPVDLAKMYGSCGQGYMLGSIASHDNHEKYKTYIKNAEICFNKAKELFTEKSDKSRQLGYLNQLSRLTGNKQLFIQNAKEMALLLGEEQPDFMSSCFYIVSEGNDAFFEKEFYIFLSVHGHDTIENSEDSYIDLFLQNSELIQLLESRIKHHITFRTKPEIVCLTREAVRLYLREIDNSKTEKILDIFKINKKKEKHQYADYQILVSLCLLKYEFVDNFDLLKDMLVEMSKELDKEWAPIFSKFAEKKPKENEKEQYIERLRNILYY